jgi:hypothetical protein
MRVCDVGERGVKLGSCFSFMSQVTEVLTEQVTDISKRIQGYSKVPPGFPTPAVQ